MKYPMVVRRFQNKCYVLEKANSSTKNGIRMKILTVHTNQKALLMFFVLGMIANVTYTLNFSIIPETSNVNRKSIIFVS